MQKEFAVLNEFIRSKGLRYTPQRESILKVFLATEKHVSAQQLHKLVKKQFPQIGYVTVYRTMRLLSQAGLCGEMDSGDGTVRYEHKYAHRHHDHLVCLKCGKLIEVVNERIEQLQQVMANRHSFTPLNHKLEIFGLCKNCRGSKRGEGER